MWNQNNKTWFDFTLNCGWQIYIWTSYIGEQWDPARHSALYKSSRSCLVDTPPCQFVWRSDKKHDNDEKRFISEWLLKFDSSKYRRKHRNITSKAHLGPLFYCMMGKNWLWYLSNKRQLNAVWQLILTDKCFLAGEFDLLILIWFETNSHGHLQHKN